MGCGGSKKKEKKTDFEMEKTGSGSIDTVFEEASAPFCTLAGVYKKLSKPLRTLKDKTGAIVVKDVTPEEIMKIMLCDFSAPCDGDIEKIELKPDDDSPFLKIKKSSLNHECVEIFEAFEKLVEHTAEAA
eukprot:CAMPEP_0168316744 /NCGR_PEP_ID=MMETSP0210-20121227/18718_1 /TAXON_ID=40633 /ORGANISM="Condylostoma magnum, Strain COL2" /LENGTH=129 /DNA_ID=CAMNT_0008303549 /DNA_START=36 /DNA_END=425 /DNA_ORIENTATION=-